MPCQPIEVAEVSATQTNAHFADLSRILARRRHPVEGYRVGWKSVLGQEDEAAQLLRPGECIIYFLHTPPFESIVVHRLQL